MRLQRLHEITAMLERKQRLWVNPSLPSAGSAGASEPVGGAGSRPSPSRCGPPAMGDRTSVRASTPSRINHPPTPRAMPSDRVMHPAISSDALRRGVALELARVRQRAQRSGNWVQLNRLQTDEGLAAFERQLRIRAHAQVQRRFNGIRPAGAKSGLRCPSPHREIETQTEEEEAAASGDMYLETSTQVRMRHHIGLYAYVCMYVFGGTSTRAYAHTVSRRHGWFVSVGQCPRLVCSPMNNMPPPPLPIHTPPSTHKLQALLD